MRENLFIKSLLIFLTILGLIHHFHSKSLATIITADNLDYSPENGVYIATGNVKIEKEEIIIKANKVIFNEITSEVNAEGSIIFTDKDVTITTQKAEINLDAKTGIIYDAVIFFRKDNYWIRGNTISKTGEKTFYASKATFTTCNSEPYLVPDKFPEDYFKQSSDTTIEHPDWCFKGQNVHIEVGNKLTAKNVAYNIKNLPVLYTPYIMTPILRDRQSGFLAPVIGSSSKKGFRFSPTFFWAIDEDKDATFYLDYLSRRGFGKGLEYRYLDETGIGIWQAYHLKDTELKKDFIALRAEDRFKFGNIKGFINVNYINDPNFYKEYGYNAEGRLTNLAGIADINRFFQSSADFSLSLKNSRLYFLTQYWVDLESKDENTLQRLPELGYTIDPFRIGPLLFSMSSSITNFYRDEGIKGQRALINPVFSYSFGDFIKLFQSLSLMHSVYNLSNNDTFDSTIHRETFEYKASALTRFYKYYSGFVHDIELSLNYRFIPKTNDLPLFDIVEFFNKTSEASISVFNSIRAKDLSASIQLAQPYDFNGESFRPLKIEASVTANPFLLRFESAYDFKKNRIDKLNSFINVRLSDLLSIYAAERYGNIDDIKFFSLGFDKVLSKKLTIGGNVSYDGKGGGLRESTLRALYRQQCWAINASFSRKPGDLTRSAEYNFSIIIELTGIGKLRTL